MDTYVSINDASDISIMFNNDCSHCYHVLDEMDIMFNNDASDIILLFNYLMLVICILC